MKRFFELYKNNDNREVAVDALLPTTTAREAIQNSMDLYAQYIFAKPEAVEGVQLFIVVLWVRRGFEGQSLRLCGSITNSVLRMMALAAIPFFSQELCTPLS
ncbi:hypothetical protein BS78_10G133600 [Paspalum vaginatum]|nr:hypothetical protein BS78_10G133600 [Paspalum vaginatum]